MKEIEIKKKKLFNKVFSDGCYDCLHFGHMNGFRQIKEKSKYLIIGTHSGEDINKEKYSTVMNDKERYEMLRHSRWIDSVETNVPFVCSIDLVKKLNIEKVFHGNDIITNADGFDCYGEIKKNNMFEEFDRTLYMSTTDLIGRMLRRVPNCESRLIGEEKIYLENLRDLFKKNNIQRKGKIIYVDGTFDLLHVGNASFLEKAKAEGDYLIVGLHSSEDNKIEKGESPIQTSLEREITLWGIKYVDEVILNAPFYPTNEFLEKMNIDVVVYAKEYNKKYYKNLENIKIKEVKSDFDYLSSNLIIHRVLKNNIKHKNRYEKKTGIVL